MSGYHSEFNATHTSMLLNRLRLTSSALLLLTVFYLYADFVLYKEVVGTAFHSTLLITHLTGGVASIFYLFLHTATKNSESFQRSAWPTRIILIYVSLYIFSGAIVSLNSYQMVGNHEAYLAIPYAVAILLPIRPKHYLTLLIVVHSFFLYGLSTLIDDSARLISAQINTTLAIFISFVVLFTLYSSLKKDFIHNKKQQELQRNFRTLFDMNPYPLFLSRLHDGELLLMNRTAFNQNQQILQDSSLSDLSVVFKHAQERQAMIEVLLQKGSIRNHTFQQELATGVTRWVMVNYERIEYNNEPCILSGVTDITEMKRMEEDLTQHAMTDELTGILNRRSGIEQMYRTLTQDAAEPRESTICFVDMNHLKAVNDHYGHQAGDDMIKDFCKVVKQQLSTEDVFFRYGGDEFIILFYRKEPQEAQQKWEQIQQDAEAYQRSSNKPYTISASSGFYPYDPSAPVSLDEIIHLADQEMYKEKLRMRSVVN